MANRYRPIVNVSGLLKSDVAACRPMANAYGASAHDMFEHVHDVFEYENGNSRGIIGMIVPTYPYRLRLGTTTHPLLGGVIQGPYLEN